MHDKINFICNYVIILSTRVLFLLYRQLTETLDLTFLPVRYKSKKKLLFICPNGNNIIIDKIK